MKKITKSLYFWVLIAIVIGIVLGYFTPEFSTKLEPIGKGFISLIKMVIAPIIFCTVVVGIVGSGDMKKVGRVGGKAILYFEIVSTIALVVGWLVINILKPGVGLNAHIGAIDTKVAQYGKEATNLSWWDFILHIIPKTFVDAFASGNLLQVLFMAILFGYVLLRIGKKGEVVYKFIESISQIFFGMMNAIMKVAPIGAGGAMAFTVGKFGIAALANMGSLMLSFYATCIIFILGVLGLIAWFTGFSIFKFLAYIKEELLIVLGTSSSETALVPLMHKLERAGCPKSVVGLVVPAGYSFNLDGTNIYITMAALFIAQALNVELTIMQELTIVGVAMLTSKGASGVTGAGFITLAATLAVVPAIPVEGMVLILGIDRFMSEARALTNFIGNGVATIVISRWEKELDYVALHKELANIKGDIVN